jgi:hypothetical protein
VWQRLPPPDSPRPHTRRFLNVEAITLTLALLLRLGESGFDVPSVSLGVACLVEYAALRRIVAAKAFIEPGPAYCEVSMQSSSYMQQKENDHLLLLSLHPRLALLLCIVDP